MGSLLYAAKRSAKGDVILASVNWYTIDATFAAAGRVLVVTIPHDNSDQEIAFYDLAHPDREPRRVLGKHLSWSLAVSPDGGLVAETTVGGQVRLFNPARGELIDTLHGHLNAAFGVSFSPDGRRLISYYGGREAVKLWDVGTARNC